MTTYSVTSWEVLCRRGHGRFLSSQQRWKSEKSWHLCTRPVLLWPRFFLPRATTLYMYCSSFAALLALLTAPTTISQTANGLTKNRYIKDRGRSEAASLLLLRKKCHFFCTQSWFSKPERQIVQMIFVFCFLVAVFKVGIYNATK